MKFYLRTFFCFCLVACSYNLFAQNKEIISKEPKFKPPVVKTYLGVNQNGAEVTLDEGIQLVGLPLKITDEKNNQYPVISYQFLYRQKSYILNDESGKKEKVFTISANRFKETPLPKLWVDNIRQRLQPEEQLYFFDIVVKDKEGREFFAPEIKITTK
ncbi:hypothetical protein EFY79_17180 [Hanamia caeni]|uniref:Uncharacterized protein n=1 Tax=Hanamia caeni TaxID=2294116 RepID=A0A3M9N9W0_9BACT|nr:hypothetical protein EFY79_17180 [Hanamia caeni]